jgi:hypothetical protein
VIREYVTAIFGAISGKMAIPLAFAFGPVEVCQIYEMFWSAFSQQFQIDLASFVLMSDQGADLRKFARKHGFAHRFCLRHFLASLKCRVFSVFVHYAVNMHTESELQVLFDAFRGSLHAAIICGEENGLRRARLEFAKAGLLIRYIGLAEFPFIEIGDAEKWAQVSSITKIREGLPMMTNCLESINGHANSQIPRRNTFWGSMSRLANMAEHGIKFFGPSVRQNFNSATRRQLLLSRVIGEAEISNQKISYSTNTEDKTCFCEMSVY